MATLEELLHPQVIFETITNRIKVPGDALQQFWGMALGGPNIERARFNIGTYDIFDSTRKMAKSRPENTGPATISPQAIAQQTIKLARFHQKIPLYWHRLHALRQAGRPSTVIDESGAQYIGLQMRYLREQFQNAREFVIAGMMRGVFYLNLVGENWEPSFSSSGTSVTIDQQVPSSNKTTLGGIITNLWSDRINADIFSNIMAINALAWAQHGYGIRHAWCNSTCWSDVTANADLKARAGSSNTVFSEYVRVGDPNNPNAATDEFRAVLRAIPWLTWHIYDGGTEDASGTFQKFFPDTGAGSCVLTPDPNFALSAMLEGSEHVAENEVDAPVERQTPYYWPQYVREPARVELVGLELIMPAMRVPKALYIPNVR